MSSRRFKPGLLPTLVTLVLLPIFIRLGFWQLERAEEKQVLQDSYAQRKVLPAFRLEPKVGASDELEYRRVYVRGRFDPNHQILIDNKIYKGQVGYYVVTPLLMTGSEQYVLINRGWVPAGKTRAELPDIKVTEGHVTIYGVMVKSRPDILMISDKNRDTSGWPARLQWLDTEEFARDTKRKVYPYIILMDADAKHGYSRDWGSINLDPDKNTSYAWQWFSFAVLLVIIYFVVNLKKIGVVEDE